MARHDPYEEQHKGFHAKPSVGLGIAGALLGLAALSSMSARNAYYSGSYARAELMVEGQPIPFGTESTADQQIIDQATQEPDRIMTVRLSAPGDNTFCNAQIRAGDVARLQPLWQNTGTPFYRHMSPEQIAEFCGLSVEEARERIQLTYHNISPQPSAYTQGDTRVVFNTLAHGNETERG